MHDITIIISRIATLKGTVNEGSLDTLRSNAIAADATIGTASEAENTHEWLETVQDTLGTMVEGVNCLNESCPA